MQAAEVVLLTYSIPQILFILSKFLPATLHLSRLRN